MRKTVPHDSAKKLFDERRFSEALKIYEDLAYAGDPQCQVFVGWMYQRGLGTVKDEQKALEWFRRAATLGSKVGAFYCGRAALAAQRYNDALPWLQQAARQDYGPALLWLGLMHTRGLGVHQDFAKGLTFLDRSAKAGNFYALREVGLLMARGKLGVTRIPLGVALVLYAVIAGIVTLIENPESENVIG